MNPWDKQQLDTGYRAQQPGYSEYASQAIEDLWPTPMDMASQMPLIGDAAGLLADTQDFVDEPSWGKGLLGLLGALPGIPSGLGSTKILDMPQATSLGLSRPFQVYENPTKAELHKLNAETIKDFKQSNLQQDVSGQQDLVRFVKTKEGDTLAWSATQDLHDEIAKRLKLNVEDSGFWGPTDGFVKSRY